MLRKPPSFWDPLDTTADFTFGCWSLPALDRLGLKDGCRESCLETGFCIPIVDQSMPTCTLLLWPSLSVCLFLGSPSSQGRDWLHLFWLVIWGRGGSEPVTWVVWHPLSIFWGVISGRVSKSSSFWGVCAQCPSHSCGGLHSNWYKLVFPHCHHSPLLKALSNSSICCIIHRRGPGKFL